MLKHKGQENKRFGSKRKKNFIKKKNENNKKVICNECRRPRLIRREYPKLKKKPRLKKKSLMAMWEELA